VPRVGTPIEVKYAASVDSIFADPVGPGPEPVPVP
jgi:hypothetical protein